jgi:outer membrane protein assembly factor BamE (lipoprotein component of BamABCDE complex)
MLSITFTRFLAAAAMAGALLLAGCATGPQQALYALRTDDHFRQIHQGTASAEVQRIFGVPDETMKFPMTRTEAWDYYYQDDWGYRAIFSVTFDAEGRTVSTLSRRINVGGDHR